MCYGGTPHGNNLRLALRALLPAPCGGGAGCLWGHGGITEEAERLLLAGEGSELERQDAINTLQRLNGTAAFAAGVCFGRRSILDMEVIAPIALGGMTRTV